MLSRELINKAVMKGFEAFQRRDDELSAIEAVEQVNTDQFHELRDPLLQRCMGMILEGGRRESGLRPDEFSHQLCFAILYGGDDYQTLVDQKIILPSVATALDLCAGFHGFQTSLDQYQSPLTYGHCESRLEESPAVFLHNLLDAVVAQADKHGVKETFHQLWEVRCVIDALYDNYRKGRNNIAGVLADYCICEANVGLRWVNKATLVPGCRTGSLSIFSRGFKAFGGYDRRDPEWRGFRGR